MVRGGIDIGQTEGVVSSGRREGDGEGVGAQQRCPCGEDSRVPGGDQAATGSYCQDSEEIGKRGRKERSALDGGQGVKLRFLKTHNITSGLHNLIPNNIPFPTSINASDIPEQNNPFSTTV